MELDTRPPAGAGIATSLVRRHVTLNLCHHDQSSLLAGKLHAIFTRSWTKGRDLFDLIWYLSDRQWPKPNLDFLNAALQQSGWKGPHITTGNLTTELRLRLGKLDWGHVRVDVEPFLERTSDIHLLTEETFQKLLH